MTGVGRIGRDRQFWIAFAAGPTLVLIWSGLVAESGPTPLPGVGPLLLMLLVLPLLEEWVFRGVLQHRLSRVATLRFRRFGVSGANATASLVFSLAHWPRLGMPVALLMLPPGLVFGHFYERHGGLAVPFLLHAWYNACALLIPLCLASPG